MTRTARERYLRSGGLGGGLVCVVLSASSLAFAQPKSQAPLTEPKPRVPLAESLSGPAKTAYETAKILVSNSDFAGAIAKYEQAYAASKDPRLLFNMAVCARNLRAYARMRGLLVRYQREAGATMSAQDKADVSDALTAIRSLVGLVRLTVNEDGATVAIDGEPWAVTPLADAIVVDLGKHALAVKKPGFEPVDEAITIAGGDNETTIQVTLRPERHVAQLVVSADPSATVTIDDARVSRQRFDGQVAPGAHYIKVTEAGKLPYVAHVDLRNGETRTLQVTLEDEHAASPWPWIVGGAAVAAGAVVGGYFLLRSPDSTAATGPNGALGSVQFARWRP